MKRIILITAVLSLLAVPAGAGEMKMKVPVDKWRQLRTRLYSLEKENTLLKKELRERSGNVESAAEIARSKAISEENARMQKQLRESSRKGAALAEAQQRLSALEEENATLRKKAAVATGGNKRMAALKKRNLGLKKKIRAMKSGSVTISYTGENRSARHEFFRVRHKVTDHVFTD